MRPVRHRDNPRSAMLQWERGRSLEDHQVWWLKERRVDRGACFMWYGLKSFRRIVGGIALLGIGSTLSGCGEAPAVDQVNAQNEAVGSSKPLDTVSPERLAPKPAGLVGDRLANYHPEAAPSIESQEPSPFRFREITAESGVDFVHFSGMNEEKHFPTANGSGVAIFDYDGDGRMDLYFATCKLIPPGSPEGPPNRLYKNLGDGKFADVTESAGVGFRGFCHGVVVGDTDNDGDQDLVLCNYGPNVFYRNNGDGTFSDISKVAGIQRPGWSSGGAFLDHDNDGDLDLYIANYGEWSYPKDNHFCGDPSRNYRLYCSPREVRTGPDFFYRNDGNNTFTDVTKEVGIGRDDGHGFGVVTADLNQDGLIDIYVANDMTPNYLFLNNGDGTFHDATEESGAAYDDDGQAQSGMGVDAEDVDGDGLPDLFVTNFSGEYNTLYQNLGNGAFFDQTPYFGLAANSMNLVGWGCMLGDFDNDGWPDLFVTNGHVDNNRETVPYAEPPLLYHNVAAGGIPDGGRRMKLATRDAGPYMSSAHVGRGAAFGDLDDNGRLDIVINHKDAPPAILLNETPTDHHWIRLKLVGTRSNRDAIGARVEVQLSDRTILRQRKGGMSMESAHDPRLLIGLGDVSEIPRLTIHWPSGTETSREHVAIDQTLEIVEPDAAVEGS